MWVVALLAANGAVLVTGLADAVDAVVEHAQPRTIAIITTADGKQIAVDPNTPAGWKAIADAERDGGTVATVAVPADAVAASEGGGGDPGVTIPGVNAGDLQNLLAGTVDHIITTVSTIVDSTGQTVVSIVNDGVTTVSSVVGSVVTTASSIVDDGTTTASSVVDEGVNTVTTLQNTVTTVQNTATSVVDSTPTTILDTVTTVQNTPTTILNTVTTLQNTVTTIQTTVTTILGGVGL